MRNLLQQGAAWKSQLLDRHASSVHTYRRGVASVRLPMTSGNPDRSADAAEQVTLVSTSRDFTFDSNRLVLGGVAIEPAPGDLIVEPGPRGRTYEVCDRGEGCCVLDAQNVRYRVFTKLAAPAE